MLLNGCPELKRDFDSLQETILYEVHNVKALDLIPLRLQEDGKMLSMKVYSKMKME